MTLSKKIKMALVYKDMTEADLARALGTSPQAFNRRMKTGKFTTEEINQIAAVLDCTYSFSFEFPDGTKI